MEEKTPSMKLERSKARKGKTELFCMSAEEFVFTLVSMP